jgi:hypothetical protein
MTKQLIFVSSLLLLCAVVFILTQYYFLDVDLCAIVLTIFTYLFVTVLITWINPKNNIYSKIGKITTFNDYYQVEYIPNLLMRVFGKKPKIIEYKHAPDFKFTRGNGGWYVARDGTIVENFSKLQKELDKHRRQC